MLDEADRILDMGFERDMNAILANLPPHRQTLLFSATQTKSVKDLARLSLNSPCYVSVHEQAAQVRQRHWNAKMYLSKIFLARTHSVFHSSLLSAGR